MYARTSSQVSVFKLLNQLVIQCAITGIVSFVAVLFSIMVWELNVSSSINMASYRKSFVYDASDPEAQDDGTYHQEGSISNSDEWLSG